MLAFVISASLILALLITFFVSKNYLKKEVETEEKLDQNRK